MLRCMAALARAAPERDLCLWTGVDAVVALAVLGAQRSAASGIERPAVIPLGLLIVPDPIAWWLASSARPALGEARGVA